jgi:hypothetical protein
MRYWPDGASVPQSTNELTVGLASALVPEFPPVSERFVITTAVLIRYSVWRNGRRPCQVYVWRRERSMEDEDDPQYWARCNYDAEQKIITARAEHIHECRGECQSRECQ